MSLESFVPKINSKQIEEKEAQVWNSLEDIQLQYCARLYEGKIPDVISQNSYPAEKGENRFKDILLNYSGVEMDIWASYMRRTGTIGVFNERELAQYKTQNPRFASYESIILKKIFDEYTTLSQTPHFFAKWMERIPVIIENQERTLSSLSAEDSKIFEKRLTDAFKEKEKGVYKSGALSYEFYRMNHLPQELINAGIKKGDVVAKIHLPALFKQTSNSGNIFSLVSDSFKKLARALPRDVDTKAIVADSWIIDTAIAKRIGFTQYEHNQKSLGGEIFWGQFVTSKGEIDFDQVNEFLKTGKPPHTVKSGYILIPEFKKKYL